MNRPPVLHVEPFFNNFIKSVGGQVISEIIPKGPEVLNADYLFKDENILAELKSFEKDTFNNEGDTRLFDMYEKWIAFDLIERCNVIKHILGVLPLPHICKQEIALKATKTIDRVIHKANKQLISTKKLLEMPDAKCLLFLINDGNYFLSHRQILGITCNLMMNKYANSEIDGFVYLTVNQTSRTPYSLIEQNVWIPSYREEDFGRLGEFVNKIGSEFKDFYTNITGVPASEKMQISDTTRALELINTLNYLAKDTI